MNAKKVTSWFNWNEWHSVMNDVYNNDDDPEKYKRAFNRILAWECRDSNLPPALIGLKELLIAKLQRQQTGSIEETYIYQSCLAMTIVRFVNFVTEPYQKGIFAKPIKTIANKIGLPDWIVNLRHNATHFNLPSIEILENARDYLFEWVKINYIDTYKEIPIEGSIIHNIKSYIRELFSEYIHDRFKKVITEEKKKSKNSDMSMMNSKIKTVTEQFRNETFEVLIENGFLIPKVEQLESIGIVVEEFLEVENIVVPKPILKIWKEFLLFCNEKNMIGLLFQAVINAYKTENHEHSINADSLRNKFLLCWILSLLDSKNEKAKQLQLEFEFNAKQILIDILTANPNRFTLSFINYAKKMALLKKSLSQEDVEKLTALVEFINEKNTLDQDQVASNESTEPFIMNEIPDFYGIFEQFQNSFNKNKMEIQHNRQQNHRKTDWILIDEPEWNPGNLKLGLIEDQNYETFDLDIASQQDKQVNEHNLSVNEAAMMRIKSGILKRPRTDEFSIGDLGDMHEDELKRIRQDLVKSYWGC